MIRTDRWAKSVRIRGLRVSVTLMRHTYGPGDERWVLQTSTHFDRRR